MTIESTPPTPRRSPLASRRRFLQVLGAAGATAAAARAIAGRDGPGTAPAAASDRRAAERAATELTGTGSVSAAGAPPAGRLAPGAVDGRVLVVVDLRGGNDGLSTLHPLDDDTLRRQRPNLYLESDQLLAVDGEVGLHPALTRLHRRGVTTVEGVGPVAGDLSHFAMTERWERGDAAGRGGLRTGFLGRLVDTLDAGSPLTGVSVAGSTPHLLSERGSTLSLGSWDDLWFLRPDDWFEIAAYRAGLTAMASGDSTDRLRTTNATAWSDLLDLAVDLDDRGGDDVDWSLPMLAEGGELGQRLYLAADLLAADVGVRVIYASDGDYDTHDGHDWRQQDNLARLDASIDGFLTRVEQLGLGDRVLVATISEFGRRVIENDGGLDHGSASTMLVAGPVGDRRLGDRPPLDDLDGDGNLRVTVGFDRYLAGLAENWLGVEAGSVLADAPKAVDLV